MKQILSILALMAVISCSQVQEKTAGIGHYPGRESESGAPSLVSGKEDLRGRPELHIEGFNLTEQEL